ncbi:MAG TPA: hypothetical protein DDZ81_24650 [Acetobacteraceae bacterium]|jgi:hypothetical protein|nr:hypothetical protein [Acetobacteraceae bacterium]
MKSKMFSAKVALIALSAAAFVSPAMAQQSKDALYAFHTGPAVGGCPGLDWHITLGADNSLTGFVAWDHGQHMARLAGALNKDRTFEMDAQEVGGQGRKAVVKGRAAGPYINVQITGSGTACDDVYLNVPRVAGGEGGGGA